MKKLKKLICISLISLLTFSVTTTAFAYEEHIFVKNEKQLTITSKATKKNPGVLLRKNVVPSETIAPKNIIPESYNSVDFGYVTSIKNQKSHNTCWAFAAMSTLESALLKHNFGSYDLSEEHLDAWATTRSDGSGWIRTLNDGTFPMAAMGYLASWQGAKLDIDIPYGYATGKTFEEVDQKGKIEYGVTSIIMLPDNHNVIKTAIMDYGAVTASFSANDEFFTADGTGAFGYKEIETYEIEGHAISIVGWDDNYNKDKLKTIDGHIPSNNGAWLCKNSWGNYNELDGYFWISYEDAYLFNEIMGSPYTIKDLIKIDDNTKMYQVEKYGATYDFNLSYDDNNSVNKMTFINKYNFTERYGNLESVTFETTSVGADYTVYLIPIDDESGNPVEDEKEWTELSRGTVDYSGYINSEVNSELPYDECAIGVTIDGTSNNVSSSFGCDEWLDDGMGTYYFIPDVQKDKSYLKLDSTIYNLSDFYNDYFNDNIGSNFVIKAITTADENVKKCDVNNDGQVSIVDAVLALRQTLQLEKLSHNGMYSADANSDGNITVTDAVLIQRKILGY